MINICNGIYFIINKEEILDELKRDEKNYVTSSLTYSP